MDMINFDGLLIGIATFLIIGLFHPVVVKAEYYWGTKCWWIFLVLGIAGTVASLLVESVFVSAICGVFAFSSFWTIKEVFEQEERVLKGWFPKNPKRTYPEQKPKSGFSSRRTGYDILPTPPKTNPQVTGRLSRFMPSTKSKHPRN